MYSSARRIALRAISVGLLLLELAVAPALALGISFTAVSLAVSLAVTLAVALAVALAVLLAVLLADNEKGDGPLSESERTDKSAEWPNEDEVE